MEGVGLEEVEHAALNEEQLRGCLLRQALYLRRKYLPPQKLDHRIVEAQFERGVLAELSEIRFKQPLGGQIEIQAPRNMGVVLGQG